MAPRPVLAGEGGVALIFVGVGLFVCVVRAADQRSGLDVDEPRPIAMRLQLRELAGMVITRHHRVLRRRAEASPNGEDRRRRHRAQIVEHLHELVGSSPSPTPSGRSWLAMFTARRLRVRDPASAPAMRECISAAGLRHAIQPRHRLGVVKFRDVRPRIQTVRSGAASPPLKSGISTSRRLSGIRTLIVAGSSSAKIAARRRRAGRHDPPRSIYRVGEAHCAAPLPPPRRGSSMSSTFVTRHAGHRAIARRRACRCRPES